MHILLLLLIGPGVSNAFAAPCTCVDTGTGVVKCDLNVLGGSSDTTLDVTSAAGEYIFQGVDEAGLTFDCRFDNWSVVGGIDPDVYSVEVIGTGQNDHVDITTYFTGFKFTADSGNDEAFGPPDALTIELDLGPGNDWVSVWGDFIDADLGPGDDVAIYGGSPAATSDTFGGDGNDCVLGRPHAPDRFWGDDGNDSFDSRGGSCSGQLGCPSNEEAHGGADTDTCAIESPGFNDCDAIPSTGVNFLTCPSYVP